MSTRWQSYSLDKSDHDTDSTAPGEPQQDFTVSALSHTSFKSRNTNINKLMRKPRGFLNTHTEFATHPGLVSFI